MALEYREFATSGLLAQYVECFWTLEGVGQAEAPPERIFPDGHPELVWNLADSFLRHEPGAKPRRQAAALLVGQITGPFLLQPTGRIELLGVRFRTAALGCFLSGTPAHVLTDLDYATSDVLGARLRTLAEEAASTRTAEARIAVVEARMREDLRHASAIDARIAAAVDIIARTHGTARVDDVASSVGSSPRQLERLFLENTGLGPKRLARITRFERLVSLLNPAPPEGWARTAIRCGYYDQAHLIRDFREFTGGPPGEFLLDGDHPLTSIFLKDR